MADKHSLDDILAKYRLGTCSDEEKAWLESWHLDQLTKSENRVPPVRLLTAQEEVKKHIDQQIRSSTTRTTRLPKIWWAAAIVIVSLMTTVMYRQLVHKENLNTTDILVADIGPGTNKAVLTTSDGASITLEGENGEILIGADAITYTDGTPVHTGHSADPEKRAIQNMLRTPKAGQYHIVLSDGTKVWLNAFSLLKFPSQFIGDERLVELTGEAYFEVSPDKKKPFKVKSQGQIIEVLGTHFNVSAYTGERTATTLVEGRVRVSDFAGTGSVVLKPHQQSVLAANSTKIHIADVDTESALAWKNGYFIFDDEGLESIMKKIERWYDVEVIYEAKVRKIEFLGRVSRSKNISSVLKALEQAGNLKFKLDGRRLRIIE